MADGVTPGDLDLPQKFSEWRAGQWEATCAAFRAKTYAFLLDAPVGSGKSLTGAALQKMLGVHTVYACHTKALQRQFLNDFPYAKLLEGRGNYVCLAHRNLFPQVTAEHCTHSMDKPCKHLSRCPYLFAKQEALRAPLAVLNMSYFLAEANFVGGFEDTPLLIIDECEVTEDQLMGFVSVVITKRQLDKLNVPPPKFKTKFDAWIDWARIVVRQLVEEANTLESAQASDWHTVDITTLRRLKDIQRLCSKLQFFIKEVDDTWVWYPGDNRWEFKPVWIGRYGPLYLWRHAQKVLGMSGTILNPTQLARNTGLNLGGRTHSYLRLKSTFPKENRMVFYKPVANLTYKTMKQELPKLTKEVQAIIDGSPDERILVHTVSYQIRDHLASELTPKARLITHSRTDTFQKLNEFKRSTDPLVMLSPSMSRGVDLPDDECRVSVICKIPWPSLGDPQVKKRVYASKDGNLWYVHRTVCTLIQMGGRIVRSKGDYGSTHILDSGFGRLYRENMGLFPDYYREALIGV